MPDLLENTQSISIDGDSRSARWKSLRGHLKQLVQVVDENNDRIAALKEEASQIRERNLKLAEAIQILSDLANEEVQREISLTLNDTDYDIVMDTPAAAPPSPSIRRLKQLKGRIPTPLTSSWSCSRVHQAWA